MDNGPTAKGLLHPIISTAALAIAIILVIFIGQYFNEVLNMLWLQALTDFLTTWWFVLIGFVLLVSVWDYIFPFYEDKLQVVKPLIQTIGLVFGLWLVAEFVAALTLLVGEDFVLQSFRNIFFEFFVWIFLLFLFIKYAQYLLKK